MSNNIDNTFALMGNILDGHNGENLYAYLAKFNHLNVGYAASAKSARESVPEIFRKSGLYITYYLNDIPTTEYFVGTKNDINNWTDDSLWQFVDGIGQVDVNSIGLNQLNNELKQLIGSNNNIVNYADGEDLTSVDACNNQGKFEINVLKFANKEYNPESFSGLGRVYLRKNITEIEGQDNTKINKNVLLQDMINTPNTKYIIQYDYDLQGETINIPENCVLDFQGGSLTNGTIVGNNTVIIVPDKSRLDVTQQGTYFFFGWYSPLGVEVIDNLYTNDTTKPLSAAQGVVIQDYINEIQKSIRNITDESITQLQTSINSLVESVNTKQDKLVNGVNIKTINNQSLLGEGNINIETSEGGSSISQAEVTNVQSVPSTEQADVDVVLEDNTLKFSFKIPAGANGTPGTSGKNGIHGSNIEIRFSAGSSEAPEIEIQNAQEWKENISDTGYNSEDTSLAYLWCIIGVRRYADENDEQGSITWQNKAIRLTGESGKNGKDGKNAPICYVSPSGCEFVSNSDAAQYGIFAVILRYNGNKIPYVGSGHDDEMCWMASVPKQSNDNEAPTQLKFSFRSPATSPDGEFYYMYTLNANTEFSGNYLMKGEITVYEHYSSLDVNDRPILFNLPVYFNINTKV